MKNIQFVNLNEQGQIPAKTFCPYKNDCSLWTNRIKKLTTRRGYCNHLGANHPVPYSCGTAREFDLETRNVKDKRSLSN